MRSPREGNMKALLFWTMVTSFVAVAIGSWSKYTTQMELTGLVLVSLIATVFFGVVIAPDIRKAIRGY